MKRAGMRNISLLGLTFSSLLENRKKKQFQYHLSVFISSIILRK